MKLRVFFSLFLLLLLCGTLFGDTPRTVQLTVSVDWEGTDLNPGNLKAMQDFHRKFPKIPLVHFLNAAYYTKPDADSVDITRKINSVIAPDDERGLHIHGWKSLFESAGVQYKNDPSLYDGGPAHHYGVNDVGHDVPISEYSSNELAAVVAKSKEILEKNGFTGLQSFRSGAWVAAPHVLEALAKEGMTADSSEVSTELINSWKGKPLHTRVGEIWPDASVTKQPYTIDTAHGPIREFPDNGGLADYVDSNKMLEIFKTNLDAHPNESVIQLHLGFHQETAATYLPRFEKGLSMILSEAKARGVRIEARTMTGEKIFSEDLAQGHVACKPHSILGYLRGLI